MAKAYLEKLCKISEALELENEVEANLDIKHFFGGAALYSNGIICASWSPSGLAFKLPQPEVNKLIASGKARSLRYFDKGHVKKGYVVFENPEAATKETWKKYFLSAITQTL